MARRTPQKFNSIEFTDGRTVLVPEGATRSEARFLIAEQLKEQRANRERAERRRQRCTEETCSHDEDGNENVALVQTIIVVTAATAVVGALIAATRKLTRRGK